MSDFESERVSHDEAAERAMDRVYSPKVPRVSDYDSLREDLHAAVAAMSSYAAAVNRKEDAVTVELERIWTDVGELRDEVVALANRLEALTHFVTTAPAGVAAKMIDDAYLPKAADNG